VTFRTPWHLVPDLRSRRTKLGSNLATPTALLTTLFWGSSEIAFQFEKLFGYQKALDFADDISSVTEQFSRGDSPENAWQSEERRWGHMSPALFRYFETAPAELFAKAEALKR